MCSTSNLVQGPFKTQLANHPVHLDLNEPKPAKYRLTKTTLRDKYENEVKTVLNNESLNDTNYKSKLKLIHTRHVSSMIQNRKPNPVTGRPAPKVNHTETMGTHPTSIVSSLPLNLAS